MSKERVIKLSEQTEISEVEHERRRKINMARTGQVRSTEYYEKHSPTWNIIKPFVLRGAVPFEIAEITGLRRSQVYNAVERKNRMVPIVESYFATDQVSRRKTVQARRTNAKRWHGDAAIDFSEKNNIEFAKKLFEEDFITEDIGAWEIISELLKSQGREESFAYKFNLEAFYIAREQIKLTGDDSLFETYLELGRIKNSNGWFASEQLNTDRRMISLLLNQNR